MYEILSNYRPEEGRFLVFQAKQGCGGLGDRLVGAISAFVLALLTQRHFRIAWDTPFPLRTVLQRATRAVPWDRQDYAGESLREFWLIDRIDSVRDYFRHADLLADGHQSLRLSANQHFFTWLLQNPFLRKTVSDYKFPEPAELCCRVMYALFRPARAVTRVLRIPFCSVYLRNSIGLQIRTLWNWQDGGGRLQPDELEHFYVCAEQLLTGKDDDVIFVTADDPSIIGRTRERFSQVEVMARDCPILHVDRSDWSDPDDYLATFADLHMLAACRHLVISHWSNYGRIAAFLSGDVPWITRKQMTSPLYPIVHEPYRRADLAELLSKEQLAPAIAGALSFSSRSAHTEEQPCTDRIAIPGKEF